MGWGPNPKTYSYYAIASRTTKRPDCRLYLVDFRGWRRPNGASQEGLNNIA